MAMNHQRQVVRLQKSRASMLGVASINNGEQNPIDKQLNRTYE